LRKNAEERKECREAAKFKGLTGEGKKKETDSCLQVVGIDYRMELPKGNRGTKNHRNGMGIDREGAKVWKERAEQCDRKGKGAFR